MGLVLLQPKKNNRNSIVPRKNTVKQSSSFWNIFRKKKKTTKKNDKRALRKSSENEVEEIKMEENVEEEEEDEIDIQLESKDKSLLLVTLWKRGIPDWLRSILWPIAISNQLEVSFITRIKKFNVTSRLLKICTKYYVLRLRSSLKVQLWRIR